MKVAIWTIAVLGLAAMVFLAGCGGATGSGGPGNLGKLVFNVRNIDGIIIVHAETDRRPTHVADAEWIAEQILNFAATQSTGSYIGNGFSSVTSVIYPIDQKSSSPVVLRNGEITAAATPLVGTTRNVLDALLPETTPGMLGVQIQAYPGP